MPCQQGPLYRAEEKVLHELPAQVLLNQEVAQDLVDSWRAFPWWEEHFPNVLRVEVYRSRRRGSAGRYDGYAQAGVADMDVKHMHPLFLAHEVAHVLASARYKSNSHDPWFARTYLELVYLALGPEMYKRLYDAFEAEGIDHRIDG